MKKIIFLLGFILFCFIAGAQPMTSPQQKGGNWSTRGAATSPNYYPAMQDMDSILHVFDSVGLPVNINGGGSFTFTPTVSELLTDTLLGSQGYYINGIKSPFIDPTTGYSDFQDADLNNSVFNDANDNRSVFVDPEDDESNFVDQNSLRSVFVDQNSNNSAFVDQVSRNSVFVDQVSGSSVFVDPTTGGKSDFTVSRGSRASYGVGSSVFTDLYGYSVFADKNGESFLEELAELEVTNNAYQVVIDTIKANSSITLGSDSMIIAGYVYNSGSLWFGALQPSEIDGLYNYEVNILSSTNNASPLYFNNYYMFHNYVSVNPSRTLTNPSATEGIVIFVIGLD